MPLDNNYYIYAEDEKAGSGIQALVRRQLWASLCILI